MVTKYLVSSHKPFIEEIEVERETEKYVFIKGKRCAKVSSCDIYVNSFEEGEQYLYDKYNKNRRMLQAEIERTKQKREEMIQTIKEQKLKLAAKQQAQH